MENEIRNEAVNEIKEKAAEVKQKVQQAGEELSAAAYSELLQIRRDKLTALQEAGRDPFCKTKYPVDAYAAEVRENFTEVAEGEQGRIVSLAGRG